MRVAIQALSAVCGGAQSIHTNSFDEALALPSEHAARIALRTQQILANEAGATDTADPLGGVVPHRVAHRGARATGTELIARIDDLGGAVAAIEQGWVQAEIEASAFRYQSRDRGGATASSWGEPLRKEESRPDRAPPGRPADRARQRERTARVRAERDKRRPTRALAEVRRTAGTDANLLPAMREALRAGVHRRRDLRRAPRALGYI